MSRTMSLRLTDDQLQAVERWKRHHNQRSISATLNLLLEEKLREERFPGIMFLDTGIGRQAYVHGTGLGVWELAILLRSYEHDIEAVARHVQVAPSTINVAVQYADAYPDEIQSLVDEYDAVTFDSLKEINPGLKRLEVDLTADIAEHAGAPA